MLILQKNTIREKLLYCVCNLLFHKNTSAAFLFPHFCFDYDFLTTTVSVLAFQSSLSFLSSDAV